MEITVFNTKLNRETRSPLLVKEKTVDYKAYQKMSMPSRIVDMMNELFSIENATEEYIYLLLFNSVLNLLGVFEVSHGTMDSALVTPREIFMKALLAGATRIILVHNHPSGYPKPSKADINMTKKIKAAGDLLAVPLLDHIVIGQDCYVSMSEENYM